MEAFIGSCILIQPNADLVLFFLVVFQLLVIDFLSNTSFNKKINQPVGIGLKAIVFRLELGNSFLVEVVFIVTDLFKGCNDFVGTFLWESDICQSFSYRLKEVFLSDPKLFTFPLGVRAAVVDIATLFDLWGDGATTIGTLYHSTKSKGLRSKFNRLLVIAVQNPLNPHKKRLRNDSRVGVGELLSLGGHDTNVEFIAKNLVNHTVSNFQVISAFHAKTLHFLLQGFSGVISGRIQFEHFFDKMSVFRIYNKVGLSIFTNPFIANPSLANPFAIP